MNDEHDSYDLMKQTSGSFFAETTFVSPKSFRWMQSVWSSATLGYSQ